VQLGLGLAPTHNQLQEFAQRIVNNQGDVELIGKNWVEGFLQIKPKGKPLRGKAIDFNHLEEATTEKVQDCFQRFVQPVVKRIPPQHRYNMDEAGLMEGRRDNGFVHSSSDDNFAILKSLVAGYGPPLLKLPTPLELQHLPSWSSKE
jgi:hypothetical protein